MPQKPRSLRSCGCLLRPGEECEHIKAAKAKRDKQRQNAKERGYDAQWQRARRLFLAEHPQCVRCGHPASVVDHIKPHRGNRRLFWLRSNWQALCTKCHNSWKQSFERKK
ncbi:HNH endonuclease [Acuticoccus sediminis]|uniref:Putative HNH nuclease YajD n=1 Tax=Acuticoccus sediminis TaxID=2184697 RepID=A0A8B2NJS0_9HYPH|nr:HNH endonuclease signature motif containing protein [Acuticoccus sediminis]RAH97621.1 HNH endonuclease [Acuticoccus sediminis]